MKGEGIKKTIPRKDKVVIMLHVAKVFMKKDAELIYLETLDTDEFNSKQWDYISGFINFKYEEIEDFLVYSEENGCDVNPDNIKKFAHEHGIVGEVDQDFKDHVQKYLKELA